MSRNNPTNTTSDQKEVEEKQIQITCSPWTKVFIETIQRLFDDQAQHPSTTLFVNLVKRLEEEEEKEKKEEEPKKPDFVQMATSNIQIMTVWVLSCIYKTNNLFVQREASLFLNSIEDAYNHLIKALVLFEKEGILPENENQTSKSE